MKPFSADPPSRPLGPFPSCSCFNQSETRRKQKTPSLHAGYQNTNSAGWLRLLERIEQAIQTGQDDFAPLEGLSARERAEVVTLPASVARLVKVQKLRFYGSHLVRIPPEIGEMRSLTELDVYTSYCLHFLPFEITRCASFRKSRVNTRALYGNYKYRPPFPDLTHTDNATALSLLAPSSCSVCNVPIDYARTLFRWITLAVATDWLPLLVSACSTKCIDALPPPPADYVRHPHLGGSKLVQPPARY